jgi:hypothetical protein
VRCCTYSFISHKVVKVFGCLQFFMSQYARFKARCIVLGFTITHYCYKGIIKCEDMKNNSFNLHLILVVNYDHAHAWLK